MTKLSNKKVKFIVKQAVNEGTCTSQLAKLYGVHERRVQQLVKEYKKTGKVPVLNKNRRPKTFLTEDQKQEINAVHEETRLSPRLLYFELKKRNNIRIPKNKIYSYLKEKGIIKPNSKKQKKRKRCRYERKHSCTLLHSDWHRTTEEHPHCILWEDDASRKILSGTESPERNTRKVIETFKQAQKHAQEYNAFIREVNTDRGTEFYAQTGNHKFMHFLEKQGITFIPSRRNNPQTNGKIERLWLEYDRHRWRFKTLKAWIEWYNNRLHGALDLQNAETPSEAFIRKLQPESIIGLFYKNITEEKT